MNNIQELLIYMPIYHIYLFISMTLLICPLALYRCLICQIPDFDRMHRKLAREMRGSPRGSTVCKPFTFKLAARSQREPCMSTSTSSSSMAITRHQRDQHRGRNCHTSPGERNSTSCKHLGGSCSLV